MPENKGQPNQKKLDIVVYEKMINDLLAGYGLDPQQCRRRPKALWSAYRGSALIFIEIFNMNNIEYIEISCPIMKMPSKKLLPFYRRLLELNFQLMGVKFFIKQDVLYLATSRELKGLDSDELKLMVNRVSGNADKFDDILIAEFKTQEV